MIGSGFATGVLLGNGANANPVGPLMPPRPAETNAPMNAPGVPPEGPW